MTINFTGSLAKQVEFDDDSGIFDNCNKNSFSVALGPNTTTTLWIFCDDKSCKESPRMPGLFNRSRESASGPDQETLRYYNYVGDDAVAITIKMEDVRVEPLPHRE